MAPGEAGDPTLGLQLFGGGGECVRHRVEQVDLAVAVEVVTVGRELGRHELSEAHGTGPRRAHLRPRCAVLQQFQGSQQLDAELVLAAAEVGLSGKHADGVILQFIGAEGRLPAPDGKDSSAVDPDLGLDLFQAIGMLESQRLTLLTQSREHRPVQIVLRRPGEFGLSLGFDLFTAGQDQIRQCQVRRQILERGVENRARHAELLGVWPQGVKEAAKPILGLQRRRCHHHQGRRRQHDREPWHCKTQLAAPMRPAPLHVRWRIARAFSAKVDTGLAMKMRQTKN